MMGNRTSAARKRRRNGPERVDVAALLNEPVKVAKNGRSQRMTAFEVSLRAQVKKALKDRNLSAIQSVLDVARTYKLLVPPHVQERGGVLVVPGRLTKEAWAELFRKPAEAGSADSKQRKVER